MPLLDHFHPPLSQRRHWESFHSTWASVISESLNAEALPDYYYAETMVHIGGQMQIDVATLEEEGNFESNGVNTVGTLPKTANVAAPAWNIPAVFPPSFEVHLIKDDGGPRLVAAIELVSPGNKDRPKTRRAFAVKCADLLYKGIALIVIDVVTSRSANLHNEMMELMEKEDFDLGDEIQLYATAYRPVLRESREEIDGWHASLKLGEPLPQLPLFVDIDLCVVVDFEKTYHETCERLKIPAI